MTIPTTKKRSLSNPKIVEKTSSSSPPLSKPSSKTKLLPAHRIPSSTTSRRLVEYFVVVSSQPRRNTKKKKKKKLKPPPLPSLENVEVKPEKLVPRSSGSSSNVDSDSFRKDEDNDDVVVRQNSNSDVNTKCTSDSTPPPSPKVLTNNNTSTTTPTSQPNNKPRLSRLRLRPRNSDILHNAPTSMRKFLPKRSKSPPTPMKKHPSFRRVILSPKASIHRVLQNSPSSSQDSSFTPKRRDSDFLEDASADSPPTPQQDDDDDILDFQPVITARYPAQDHPDNPLNTMVTKFCHPNSDKLYLTQNYIMPKIHHFVLTNDKGNKLYGTCLTFYEPYQIPDEESSGSLDFSPDSDSSDSVEIHVRRREFYLPKCICILSTWPYLTAFREYLTQLYKLATSTDCMKAPLERYIVNLCEEIPAPPPGKFEIQTRVLGRHIRFWAPPANQPIAYVAISFKQLFSCLDISNIIFLWNALALERKVLLVSSQKSLLTTCAETLLSLLFPMNWTHLYIPVLPAFLTPMLDAPMPYLCGICRTIFSQAASDLSQDAILVDLDKNEVTMGPTTLDLPPLPPRRRHKLEKALEGNAGHVFWKARCVSKHDVNCAIRDEEGNYSCEEKRKRADTAWKEQLRNFDDAFCLAYTPNSLHMEEEEVASSTFSSKQSAWDAVQEAFLRFYVSLLKDYRKFLNLTPICTKRWSSKGFLNEEFLESQPLSYRPFLAELCETQQFDDFITKRLYDPGRKDVLFFDQSIDAKLNRSKLKFRKTETPFLRSFYAHKQLNTIFAVEPNAEQLLQDDDDDDAPVKYRYSTWPEELDETLYVTPRPYPEMIGAEFDRLTNNVHPTTVEEEWEEENPGTATFALFFYLYTATIGVELAEFAEEFQFKKVDKQDGKTEKRRKGRGMSTSTPQKKIDELEGMDVSKKAKDLLGIEKEEENQHQSARSKEESSNNGRMAPLSFVDHPGDFRNRTSNDQTGSLKVNSHHSSERKSNISHPQSNKESLNRLTSDSPSDTNHSSLDTRSDTRSDTTTTSSTVTSRSDVDANEFLTTAELEEARDIAMAQLDLAFGVLDRMKHRHFIPNSDIYKNLVEACGRCGDTERATQLMGEMSQEGIMADGVMHTFFMRAFNVQNLAGLMASPRDTTKHERVKSAALFRKGLKAGSLSNAAAEQLKTFSKPFLPPAIAMDSIPESSSPRRQQTDSTITTTASSTSSFMNDIYNAASSYFVESNDKPLRKKDTSMQDSILKQILLSESLLEYLYPDLQINTQIDSCPKCSHALSEPDILSGWNPHPQQLTTTCPQCHHKLIPHFSIQTSLSTFEGSQGKHTPLYCRYLSPWVLRHEFQSLLKTTSIEEMIKPKWRNNCKENAVLWWNLIVAFHRRETIPITFLLQGSVKNRLITPNPAVKG